MGGEKFALESVLPALPGSPPRGRGKEVSKLEDAENTRITPAWAGKRCRHSHACACDWDHPRVGGEKTRPIKPLWVTTGSPPRGRGKVEHPGSLPECPGITPAWAGKSSTGRKARTRSGDHPRVGGEKSFSFSRASWSMGSPPRGRGKASGCGITASGKRITPAWAGKS